MKMSQLLVLTFTRKILTWRLASLCGMQTFLASCGSQFWGRWELNSEADESSILRQVRDWSGKLEVSREKLASSWKQQLVALPVISLYHGWKGDWKREWVTWNKRGDTRERVTEKSQKKKRMKTKRETKKRKKGCLIVTSATPIKRKGQQKRKKSQKKKSMKVALLWHQQHPPRRQSRAGISYQRSPEDHNRCHRWI